MRTILHEILDRSGFSPITLARYVGIIDRWIQFAGADPSGWTRQRAQDFYDDVIANGVSPRSAKIYIASLRYVSHWYATRNANPHLDFAIVQTRRYPTPHKREALTEDAARALLETCLESPTPIDQRDLVMLVVGLETGMRRMSLTGMQIENIGEQNGYPIITIPIKGSGGSVPYAVPLSDLAFRLITRWRGWLAKHGFKTHGPILPRIDRRLGNVSNIYTPAKTNISHSTVRNITIERALEAGIGHVHPHLLRHTFVTWRQLAGLSAVQIASMTGHRSFGKEYGSVGVYVDMKAIAAPIRNATPSWLADLLKEF